MIVPVEVFGVMIELRIPINYAIKKMGSAQTIRYRDGLTKEQEEFIINYYYRRIFERILLLMFNGEIECKAFMKFGFVKEYDIFKNIGYTNNSAYFSFRRSKVIDEIIDNIIFDYPINCVSEWCMEKYKEEFEKNRINKIRKAKQAKKTKIVFKANVVKVTNDDINIKLDILKDILLGGESKEKKAIEKVVSLYIEKKKLIEEKKKQIELLQKEIMALSTK
jgi:hypothetical protein